MQGFVRTADKWPCQQLCRQQFLCRSPGSPLTSVLSWKATSHVGLFLPATSWEPGQACVECACVCVWLRGEGALWDADLREDFFLRASKDAPGSSPSCPQPLLCCWALRTNRSFSHSPPRPAYTDVPWAQREPRLGWMLCSRCLEIPNDF